MSELTRKELDLMIEQSYIIVKDDEDYMVDNYNPEERVVYVHSVELGEDYEMGYDEIDDTCLIYKLQLLNPAK